MLPVSHCDIWVDLALLVAYTWGRSTVTAALVGVDMGD
jgi:hypothetical protein